MIRKMCRILIGFAGTVTLLAAQPVWAEEHPLGQTPYVTPVAVKTWQEEKEVVFLDVREPDEFAAGHLPGARNIVWTEVASLIGQLPKDRPIVTYCIHSAHRAPEAAKTLRSLGFENAYVLEGGIVAWQAGGLSLRANDLAKVPTILPVTERCKVKAS